MERKVGISGLRVAYWSLPMRLGGGTSATTAAVKGGLGTASTRTAAGHIVAALAVVNAVGSPLIREGPCFWAAPYEQNGEFCARGWLQAATLSRRQGRWHRR